MNAAKPYHRVKNAATGACNSARGASMRNGRGMAITGTAMIRVERDLRRNGALRGLPDHRTLSPGSSIPRTSLGSRADIALPHACALNKADAQPTGHLLFIGDPVSCYYYLLYIHQGGLEPRLDLKGEKNCQDLRFGFYSSSTVIAPCGQEASHALQPRHSSGLAATALPS